MIKDKIKLEVEHRFSPRGTSLLKSDELPGLSLVFIPASPDGGYSSCLLAFRQPSLLVKLQVTFSVDFSSREEHNADKYISVLLPDLNCSPPHEPAQGGSAVGLIEHARRILHRISPTESVIFVYDDSGNLWDCRPYAVDEIFEFPKGFNYKEGING